MRAYSNNTFRHGFEARELKDLFEVGSRMSAPVLNGAARRAVEVLVADMGDDEKVDLVNCCRPRMRQLFQCPVLDLVPSHGGRAVDRMLLYP